MLLTRASNLQKSQEGNFSWPATVEPASPMVELHWINPFWGSLWAWAEVGEREAAMTKPANRMPVNKIRRERDLDTSKIIPYLGLLALFELVLANNLIDQAVLFGLLRGHEFIALGILGDLL